MKKLSGILSAIVFVFCVAGTANAVLIDRGVGMIYDSDQDITWLQDAGMGGKMTWSSAINWAKTLEYNGYDDWRLTAFPSIGNLPYPPYDNIGEMSYLYYTVLGNSAGGPLVNTGSFVMPTDIQTFWLGTANPDTPTTGAWSLDFSSGWLNSRSQGDALYAWAVRNGDYGPSVSESQTYETTMLLGSEISFDYWWEMGIEPEPGELNLDILFFHGDQWEAIGGDINFNGSSTEWETASFWVPEWARGMETQLQFVVKDWGVETDPTVYLNNIASNAAPVPEPSTIFLMCSGLIAVAGFRRKIHKGN